MSKVLTTPSWFETLRARFEAGITSVFVLHGNVHDDVPWDGDFVPLREFLARRLRQSRDTVLFYDVARGLQFAERSMEAPFRAAVDAARRLQHGAPLPDDLPRDPYRLFPWLETFLRDRSQRGALVLEYAETLCPQGELAQMGEQDRAIRVTLQRWASDPSVVAGHNAVILLTENLSDLDRVVRSSPQIEVIEIPLPSAQERAAFASHLDARMGPSGMPPEDVAAACAGLTNHQIERLVRESQSAGAQLTRATIDTLKRRIIERECWGLIEFVQSSHDFSVVGGMQPLKDALLRIVAALRAGDRARVPMGVLLVGPMGTGKSFLMEAFANEVGLTAVKLKNFRDKWVGSTEANLERVLGVVKALGNVMVVIDEGDRSIGGQGEGGDGGVDSRVIARLKEFMADTSHRGSILFVMMTNRPDKLDADMKRAGRFDLKLAFFPPQTPEERELIVRALLKKNKLKHALADVRASVAPLGGYTGAELEALLLAASSFAQDAGRDALDDEDLRNAVADFIPSRDEAMLLYMELLAVFECSSRRMLPERYRNLPTEELNTLLRAQQRHLLKP